MISGKLRLFFDHSGQKNLSTLLRYIYFALVVAVLLVVVTDTHNNPAKRHPDGTRFIIYLKRVFSRNKKVPNLCRPDRRCQKGSQETFLEHVSYNSIKRVRITFSNCLFGIPKSAGSRFGTFYVLKEHVLYYVQNVFLHEIKKFSTEASLEVFTPCHEKGVYFNQLCPHVLHVSRQIHYRHTNYQNCKILNVILR